MAGTGKAIDSLRPTPSDTERFVLVLLLSLALHLLTWGGYEAGKKLGWWQQLHWPAWLHRAKKLTAMPLPPVVNQEPPLEFVTVDNPSTEAPKKAKFYSSHNSQAADLTGQRDTDSPQLNGKQTDVPKVEDVQKPQFSKLQPSPPAQPEEQQQQQSPEQQAMNAGDLSLGKPQDSQPQENPQPPRPRTIRQALAQQNRTPGVMMRQDAGAHRRALVPSLDALGTQFGAYDAAIVEAIQQYWDDELDSQRFAEDRSGRVTLRFHLNYDGSISEMQVVDNNVGELLGYVCQQAIVGSAPFAKWPSDMRREIGANFREITFSFYYY